MAARKTPSKGSRPDKLMRDALALELAQDVKLEDKTKVKRLRLVARQLVDNAVQGDTTAIKEIFDRMDGKVSTDVNATVTGTQRIVVEFPGFDAALLDLAAARKKA